MNATYATIIKKLAEAEEVVKEEEDPKLGFSMMELRELWEVGV